MATERAENILGVEAQARLAAIVESSDDGIVSKTLDGIITSWNKGAERIFGYRAEEIVGRSITVLIPADRQHEEVKILSMIRAGERVEHFETVRVRKDGRFIDVSVTISPIRNSDGAIVGASKIARDVTAQKQIRRELEVAKEAAEVASKAKDQFLSVLSHELRTPLTPVLASVSFLERIPDLPPELREQIGMIRRNVETEARLVDDLLDLTRIARGKVPLHFEVVDAHAVVRNVVAVLQSEIDAKRLAVTTALRAADYHVWADPGRLQQIFLNLLSNAVKFTPSDGAIILRSSNHDDMLRVEVTDTGIGIEPEVLSRLFNAFEQGEQAISRRFGGLGLGLSITKAMVELHNGSVTAVSEGKDKGATFTVDFATVPPVQEDSDSPLATARGRCSLRILLVEDHADTRQIMARLLRNFGCTVTAAGSVREALAVSEKQQVDLLVSDIGLPDGSGIELMKRLRARHPVRGIALSGFGQDEDLRKSMEAGFEMHLVKPVNFRALQDVIAKLAD